MKISREDTTTMLDIDILTLCAIQSKGAEAEKSLRFLSEHVKNQYRNNQDKLNEAHSDFIDLNINFEKVVTLLNNKADTNIIFPLVETIQNILKKYLYEEKSEFDDKYTLEIGVAKKDFLEPECNKENEPTSSDEEISTKKVSAISTEFGAQKANDLKTPTASSALEKDSLHQEGCIEEGYYSESIKSCDSSPEFGAEKSYRVVEKLGGICSLEELSITGS
jgi:hypothetical protein